MKDYKKEKPLPKSLPNWVNFAMAGMAFDLVKPFIYREIILEFNRPGEIVVGIRIDSS